MTATLSNASAADSISARGKELFESHLQSQRRRTDQLFACLLMVEWIAGIIAALVVSPKTWQGAMSQTHAHVYAAVYLGAIIVSLPIAMALWAPGRTLTRYVVTVGQILFSSLLIHLMGGRIETHFHVFGSLAFLASYRDWRVMVLGSLLVGIDHFTRGIFWPQSVYGVLGGAQWRFLEHVGWVAFEDLFLILLISQSLSETREIADRQAELEAAKRQVEAANDAKTAFVANMSHEIRTPLTAIMGFTDLMAMEELPAEERLDFVRTIRRNSEHLLSILNDVLDMSKVEAGRMTVESVVCYPVDLVEDVATSMRPRAEEKGLKLRTGRQEPIPASIVSDPTRVRQILMNLASNAIKFTGSGTIDICLRTGPWEGAGGMALAVDVIDSGIGLTAEQQSRLFNAFAQAEESTSRRYGGTGLGLTISKRLAELLGGTIRVESTIDRGSYFTLWLPITANGNSALHPAPARPNAPMQLAPSAVRENGDGARILLVDDSADNRDLLVRLFERAGMRVEVAENGGIAVQRVLQSAAAPIDVVLMDINMPEMDGYAATALLRERGYTGAIIAVTACASEQDRAKCLAAGCDEHVAKPIDVERLLLKTMSHVKRSRGERPGPLRQCV